MTLKRLSVADLQMYWWEFDQLKEGEGMMSLPHVQMPPWNDLCSKLSWQTFIVGGGYFPSKSYGYAACTV
jgi:hypothetical protein